MKCKGLFIVGAKRTPFCKHGGSLRELPASHAFAAAAKDAIAAAKLDPNTIDSTVVGNVNFLSQCDGGKTPRYCGIYSGVPIERPALGVSKACASGIQAIITGAVDILTGAAKVSLTGGTEIMSALPHLVRNIRFGTALGANYQVEDYIQTELIDSYCGKSIQRMSEDLAQKHGVKREEADQYAIQSHLTFKAAQEKKEFDDEITSLTVTLRNEDVLVDKDETLHLSAEDLSQLPALLDGGTVLTTGNVFKAADGASALLLANEDAIKEQNLKPLARISGWACVGVNPEGFALGGLQAVNKLLEEKKMTVEDVDLFEVNETFASQMIIMMNELRLEPSRVNVRGGTLPIGHPAAATGARMVTHLVHQLNNNKVKRGVATSGCGGGQGVAIMLEAV